LASTIFFVSLFEIRGRVRYTIQYRGYVVQINQKDMMLSLHWSISISYLYNIKVKQIKNLNLL
jgi:hypothetical protein